RGRDQRHRRDPLGPGHRGEAGDPAAHGRAHQQRRPLDQLVQHRERILAPAGDRPLGLEVAAGLAVAEVVEAHAGAPGRRRPVGQRLRLGPAHVGAEAAQPDERRPGSIDAAPGDLLAVGTFKFSGALAHRRTDSARRSLRHPVSGYARQVALPPDFTLLQVVPELETGGAEQTTIDVARAVIAAGGQALVATRGGRMAARLESDGGRLTQMPVQSKNPLVMLGNAARLVDLIRTEKVSLVHARSRAPAFSALWAAQTTKTPFVATYHGVYKANSALKRWYNAVMTRGDLVIANSDYTRD